MSSVVLEIGVFRQRHPHQLQDQPAVDHQHHTQKPNHDSLNLLVVQPNSIPVVIDDRYENGAAAPDDVYDRQRQVKLHEGAGGSVVEHDQVAGVQALEGDLGGLEVHVEAAAVADNHVDCCYARAPHQGGLDGAEVVFVGVDEGAGPDDERQEDHATGQLFPPKQADHVVCSLQLMQTLPDGVQLLYFPIAIRYHPDQQIKSSTITSQIASPIHSMMEIALGNSMIAILQSAPQYPLSQRQFPSPWHTPCSLQSLQQKVTQQLLPPDVSSSHSQFITGQFYIRFPQQACLRQVLQSSPPQQSSQWHPSSQQVPWLEHTQTTEPKFCSSNRMRELGQAGMLQSSPVMPFAQTLSPQKQASTKPTGVQERGRIQARILAKSQRSSLIIMVSKLAEDPPGLVRYCSPSTVNCSSEWYHKRISPSWVWSTMKSQSEDTSHVKFSKVFWIILRCLILKVTRSIEQMSVWVTMNSPFGPIAVHDRSSFSSFDYSTVPTLFCRPQIPTITVAIVLSHSDPVSSLAYRQEQGTANQALLQMEKRHSDRTRSLVPDMIRQEPENTMLQSLRVGPLLSMRVQLMKMLLNSQRSVKMVPLSSSPPQMQSLYRSVAEQCLYLPTGESPGIELTVPSSVFMSDQAIEFWALPSSTPPKMRTFSQDEKFMRLTEQYSRPLSSSCTA